MTKSIIANSFTPKDYLTITLSIIALTISGINFYYGNLKIDDDLQISIATKSKT